MLVNTSNPLVYLVGCMGGWAWSVLEPFRGVGPVVFSILCAKPNQTKLYVWKDK